MRTLLAPFAVFLALSGPARAGDAFFRRVWPQWHDADSFLSVYEDHTGRELVGKWTIIRSHPDARGGMYFLSRVINPGPKLEGATIVIRVISPDSTNTRVFTFTADIPKGKPLFELGLTGKDWAGPKAEPVSWEVELHSADGRLLDSKTSYLWEKPAT
jgi:hypothetical protein